MTQEEKQLLLKDLCGRLPYNPYIFIEEDNIRTLLGSIEVDKYGFTEIWYDGAPYSIEDVKPYLRPMSSMTEEELNECVRKSGIKDIECPNWQDIPKEKQFEARLNHSIAVFLTDSNNVDWLNEHHFDYRGLIEKGLALEAPEDMYKTV